LCFTDHILEGNTPLDSDNKDWTQLILIKVKVIHKYLITTENMYMVESKRYYMGGNSFRDMGAYAPTTGKYIFKISKNYERNLACTSQHSMCTGQVFVEN
jgi:hypothetical protein